MTSCVSFFRFGTGIGTLTVYLQKEGFQPISMWTLSGLQEDNWLQGKVGFVVNSDHSILIEAKINQDDEGDIAIDDLSITNGYCPTYPAYAVPVGGFTTTLPTITTGMFVTKQNLTTIFLIDRLYHLFILG